MQKIAGTTYNWAWVGDEEGIIPGQIPDGLQLADTATAWHSAVSAIDNGGSDFYLTYNNLLNFSTTAPWRVINDNGILPPGLVQVPQSGNVT